MMQQLLAWLDHRTGIKGLMHEALFERIPGGARWRYVWGSALVFTFSLQMITGIFLLTAYSGSTQTAWESVYYIQEQMTLGWLVRGIHHFAAQAMTVLLAFHLIQIIVDGAYKAPREVNYWLGLILMQIVLGLGLTGYLLPWDQKGYYATQVSTKIMSATPLVGPALQTIAQGGNEYGHATISRFLAMHVVILPAALIGFLALHIYVFRRHGIHAKTPLKAADATFWPDQVLKDAVAALGVLAVVMGFAIFKGAELNPPADPADAFEAARPEWYFLFLFRFLKFEAVEHLGLAFGAIHFPGFLFTVLAAAPLIARVKWGHKFNVAFLWLIAGGAGLLTVMAIVEDNANDDHQMALREAERDSHRIRELAQSDTMIPVDGAVSLLRKDPFTQGPKLFAKHCAGCHRYEGHNGRGRLLMTNDPNDPATQNNPSHAKKVVAQPEATDLADFGSRDWMKAVLLDYSKHFGPLKNAQWFKDDSKAKADGKEVEFIHPDESEMAAAVNDEYAKLLSKPENADDLSAVVEFLVAQRNRASVDKIDEKLAARGQEILNGGKLKDGSEIGNQCSNCHDKLGSKFELTDSGNGYPDLAGYGSKEWLTAFLKNPGSEQFYGKKNRMPAYGDKLRSDELELLVRWMTGDYFPTHVADYASRKRELPK